jgi:hypothetical protein
MGVIVCEDIYRRTPPCRGEEMQKSPSCDIRVPLCCYKKARAGAGGAGMVRGREGAEGSFFFDDEDPVARGEGEVRYILGIRNKYTLDFVSI